ncbi:hypothetical protein ATANTOWER_006404 [Ataeniobius toweri]|uniref:Uncharacterized protein n=1 Tax=Ataeniobius toweri TaxID=208326 RepID=A0ABU7A1Q3_9TELE|nr:hypothetical protein [Ataeniobius toweri]
MQRGQKSPKGCRVTANERTSRKQGWGWELRGSRCCFIKVSASGRPWGRSEAVGVALSTSIHTLKGCCCVPLSLIVDRPFACFARS